MQDVGLIARGPHPHRPRGDGYLAERNHQPRRPWRRAFFIDAQLRDTNERYLESAFGNVESFCILMNIPVKNNIALPPNLWRENTRLYEWSAETGARWGDRLDGD